MRNNSADQFFPRTARSNLRGSREARKQSRIPSSAGYLLGSVVAAVGLFFALWWMFVSGGDEAPWVPAGLAASVVLLVALSAREVVMRRAWTRYLLEQDDRDKTGHGPSHKRGRSSRSYSFALHATTIREIQKRSVEADSSGTAPELHLDLFNLCKDYLTSTDETLRSSNLASDKRVSLRAGQERVKALQKHHLLTWARDASRAFTHEAQQRARTTDKIETANRALDCLDTALKIYPEEPELNESKLAIRDFIASIRVAHWVELAERSAFKGHYRRAIARYQDALFYLLRDSVKDEVRISGTERINRQIDGLRARVAAAGRQNSEKKRDL